MNEDNVYEMGQEDARPEEEKTEESFLRKAEAAIFPLAAATIGIGYSIGILVNNPIQEVLHSPHAIILLVILLSIAFLPLRSLIIYLMKKNR